MIDSTANAMHDAREPAIKRLHVDPKGQVRMLHFKAYVATPTNGWPTLESLYAAEDFADGYAVYQDWLAAIAAGKIVDPLPDEWLPKSVVAMRAAAATPDKWEPPKREAKTTKAKRR